MTPGATPANFKVAFIGDTGVGTNFKAVLSLVKSEAADMLLIGGDLGYAAAPTTWMNDLNSVLGADFPVFAGTSDADRTFWWRYATGTKAIEDEQEQQRIIRRRFGGGPSS